MALLVDERVLGAEHPDILALASAAPTGPGGPGMRPGPRSGHRAAAYPGAALGREHPRTLADRGEFAICTGAAGVRDQFAALLLIRERMFGPSTQKPRAPGKSRPQGKRSGWVTSAGVK